MIIHSLKGQGLSVASRDEAEKAGPNLRPVKIFAEVMQDRLPGRYVRMYRVVQKKGTVLPSTSLSWPAVAGCSRAETFSQLSSISFAQPCNFVEHDGDFLF